MKTIFYLFFAMFFVIILYLSVQFTLKPHVAHDDNVEIHMAAGIE